MASSPTLEEVLGLVVAMDAALTGVLPASIPGAVNQAKTSLQAERLRHAEEFMDAAKKIQIFFTLIGRQYQPSREYVLKKEIAALEKELKAKDDLMQRQLQLVSKWKLMLQSQKTAAVAVLEKVGRSGNEPVID